MPCFILRIRLRRTMLLCCGRSDCAGDSSPLCEGESSDRYLLLEEAETIHTSLLAGGQLTVQDNLERKHLQWEPGWSVPAQVTKAPMELNKVKQLILSLSWAIVVQYWNSSKPILWLRLSEDHRYVLVTLSPVIKGPVSCELLSGCTNMPSHLYPPLAAVQRVMSLGALTVAWNRLSRAS